MIITYHLTGGAIIRADATELGATEGEIIEALASVVANLPVITVRDMDNRNRQVMIFTAHLQRISLAPNLAAINGGNGK